MGLYRIYPTADTWITDRIIDTDVTVTATGSNMGLSPSLSVYAYQPQVQTGSVDLARALLKFDVTQLSGKIYDEGIIPSSSVTYYLRMFNMEHGDTIPTSYDLFVYPLSRSWDEGAGLDEDEFLDKGFANWEYATSTATWTATGSDFLTTEYGSGSQHFDRGHEDLEMDITDIVINWLTGSISQNGVVLKLGATEEDSVNDYFRKAFHSRQSKYVDRLPYIEARWNDVKKDNRKNFAYDQYSHLYLYNFVRGELVNLTEPVVVKVRDNLHDVSASYNYSITASRADTGVYSASFYVENTASFSASWYDVWHSGSRAYMTGTFNPLVLTGSQTDQYDEFTVDITNLKRVYTTDEEARMVVNVRKRDYFTHMGCLSSASLDIEREYIEKMYYSIENDTTGEVVVPYGTGSVPHTQLSYDGEGNYFNLYFNGFVPGFVYRIKFLIDINRYDKKIYDENLLFRVV